ncbi:MAG: Rrf2 family transcriptional regulator [Lewinellaceae bacterium]|nr:Rrf2 family transcriptional regulator [Lewinellaceae bacterium]
MKVLSKPSEYGLRALMFLVTKGEGKGYVNIREMAEELDISFHFLTKILQSLTQAGFLVSSRGPNGGISFARNPQQISLLDVLYVLEGQDFLSKCLLGLPGCGDFAPCPMHNSWAVMRVQLRNLFEHTNLSEVGQSVQLERLRLSP